MLSETDVEVQNSSVRLIDIERNGANCGFNLTRGKWDPYPWVSSVDPASAADLAGLKPGDCLLEVNGEDILGQRISEVAEIVKSKPDQVSLLLWNAGVDPQCTPEAVCCGPMPTILQRLSACMSTILAFLECPVCLDTIPPPTYQCENGHLICFRCRTKTERCPVCRSRLSRGRSLLSDQVYNALVDAFNLREESVEARTAKMHQIFKMKTKAKGVPEIKVTPSHTNKFLERLVGKASSVDNLAEQKYVQNLLTDESNFRSKSLSTQEIFQFESPVTSRSNSITRIHRNNKNLNFHLRPSSCHGSFESLNKKINDGVDEEILFHCPFSPCCTSLIKGTAMVKHFQSVHDGPLVQYFKPEIKIHLDRIFESPDLCYLVQTEENTFFVKIERVCGTETCKSENILLWSWVMDTKQVSKEHEMHIKVTCGSDVVISVRNSVCSLNCTSYQDIKDFKKGVLFNTKTIKALNPILNDVSLEISITKNDCI